MPFVARSPTSDNGHAMSRENDETVRAHFETWNAGDMEAHSDLFDPDVIAWMPEGWPEPGPFVRRDAVLRQQLQMRETWDTDEARAHPAISSMSATELGSGSYGMAWTVDPSRNRS